jgi:hypothetical protein
MFVAQQLGAPVEQVGEGHPAVLGVELVLLFHRDPGQIETLGLDLLVSLRLFGLQPGQLVPGRLPFLASSDPVSRHLISLRLDAIRALARGIHRQIGRYRDHDVRPVTTRELIAAGTGGQIRAVRL